MHLSDQLGELLVSGQVLHTLLLVVQVGAIQEEERHARLLELFQTHGAVLVEVLPLVDSKDLVFGLAAEGPLLNDEYLWEGDCALVWWLRLHILDVLLVLERQERLLFAMHDQLAF